VAAEKQKMKTTSGREKMRIAFCHPDLGLGGAERLVVDAACELCNYGHKVRNKALSSKLDRIGTNSAARFK
jgi:hypothetical protein